MPGVLSTRLVIAFAFASAGTLASTGPGAPAHGNITPIARGNVEAGVVLPAADTDVRVLNERLVVEITPPDKDKHHAPTVSVDATYALRHDGDTPINLDVAFPLTGGVEPQHVSLFKPRIIPPEPFSYTVTLDDAALTATAEPLPIPQVPRTGIDIHGVRGIVGPVGNDVDPPMLTAVFVRWVESDKELTALLAEYTRIAPSARLYSEVRQRFEDEAGALLGLRKNLTYQLESYLRDRDSESAIRALVPAANERRVGTAMLPPPPEGRAPVNLEKYQRDIDEWIATRPSVRERYAELERQIDIQRTAQAFMTARVGGHLRGKGGLSELAVARLLNYLTYAYNPHPAGRFIPAGSVTREVPWPEPAKSLPAMPPDFWLVAQIDPAIERERQARIAKADALLDRYGFDSTFLSPLTAKGYSKRVGWRDDSTWTPLDFQAPPLMEELIATGVSNFSPGMYSSAVTAPRSEARLIRFTVPLKPGETRSLRVSYRTLAEIDELDRGKSYAGQIVHVRYILKTARDWKSFGPIDLTVRLPAGGLAVMEPTPGKARAIDGGRVEFETKIERPADAGVGNLRIAWLPANDTGRSKLFALANRGDLADLQRLEKSVEHPQAQRVIRAMATLAQRPEVDKYSPPPVLTESAGLLREGFSEDLAVAIGAPDSSSSRSPSDVRDVRNRLDQVRRLAREGWPESLLPVPMSSEEWDAIYKWSKLDWQAAVDLVERERIEPATPRARLAQAYFKLLASAKPSVQDCEPFVRIAREDEQLTLVGLMLVHRFPGDPRGFGPLVTSSLTRKLPKDTPGNLAHNLPVVAMWAFSHGAVASVDEAMATFDTLDDGGVASCSVIPHWFGREMSTEQVRQICDRLARAGELNPRWYHALYVRDSAVALKAMDEWMAQRPDDPELKRARDELRKESAGMHAPLPPLDAASTRPTTAPAKP
jgi:hypothetical protein